MPRSGYNIGRQRSRNYNHTTNGLLTLRGVQLRALRLGTDPEAQANIDAIDRVLVNCIGYEGDIAEASKDYRREMTFKRGELRRAVADALRKADRPLTTREIAVVVHATKGVEITPDKVGKERITRVRAVCKKLANVQCEAGPSGCVVWSRPQNFTDLGYFIKA